VLTERLTHLPAYAPVRQFNADGEREYLTPIGIATGVTTVLSGTRDNTSLDLWREDIGVERARHIVEYAAFRGTRHHNNIETYLDTGTVPTFDFASTPYWNSTWPFIQTIETTLLQEGALWHPMGYAGTCDCIAYLPEDGCQPTLLDWKTADKPANKIKLYDYCLQVAAYVAAANYVYGHFGLNIQKAVIVIAVKAQQPQIEYIDSSALEQYFKHFEARLKRYTFARSSTQKKSKKC
jgi:hypothetical protein